MSHSSAESEILSLDAGFTRKWFTRASVLGVRDADFKLAPEARCNARLKQDVIALTCREVCFFFENIDHGLATILHQSSTNTTLLVGRHCGSDPNDHERTKPKLEARHKNARS